MKQQVNLYQPILYPVRQQLGLQQLVVAWLLVLLLLLAGWFWLQLQQNGQQQQLTLLQQQLALQQQELSLYQDALLQRQPAAALVTQLQLEERAVLQKQQLLSYLSVQQQQASLFYSPVLQHLHTIDRPELWLTQFTLQQQHSSFSGIALRPDKVPLWLEDLRQLGYFHGQSFSQVNMQQVPEHKAVNFQLVAQQGIAP
jgi:Tfp pilus assembly protein PilN